MSASRNAEANANQPGEFGSHVPRTAPETTHGHQPGRQVGNDAVPEFHAKTLPPGSAPTSSTFTPNTTSEVPAQAPDNTLNERSHGKESTKTTASSTLGGSTSGDVHTGLGQPMSGMTSSEVRHEGAHTSKKQSAGLQGVGASGAGSEGYQIADERLDPKQRGIERDSAAGTAGRKEGTGPDKGPSAEERENVQADQL